MFFACISLSFNVVLRWMQCRRICSWPDACEVSSKKHHDLFVVPKLQDKFTRRWNRYQSDFLRSTLHFQTWRGAQMQHMMLDGGSVYMQVRFGALKCSMRLIKCSRRLIDSTVSSMPHLSTIDQFNWLVMCHCTRYLLCYTSSSLKSCVAVLICYFSPCIIWGWLCRQLWFRTCSNSFAELFCWCFLFPSGCQNRRMAWWMT